MYFILSKIGWLILSPTNALVMLASFGTLLVILGRRIAGLVLLVPALACLACVGLFGLDEKLALSLETRFPVWKDDGRPVDGIVVLGGGIRLGPSSAWDRLELNSAGDRLVALGDLSRRYPSAKIVYTGGYGAMFGRPVSEADILARHASTLGVDPSRLVYEGASRNTRENAVFTRDLVKPQAGEHWLLVTSAWHMPRSMGLFRKAGWSIEAYPVGFTSAPGFEDTASDKELSVHLDRFDTMVREYVGLAASYLAGYSDAVFPAP